MSLLPALLQREDDWTGYIWFAVFVVLPVLARVGRWLLVRAGLLREEQKPAEVDAGEAERRAEQRRSQAEGEDLWRRLARGELDAPAAPPPAPTPVPVPVPPRGVSPASLELEEEPRPLSVLGEVSETREPSEAPERSLEDELEPVPLQALAAPAAQEAPPGEPLDRPRVFFRRGELRRAIVLAELLGPPVSERSLRA